ncbi:hypothetical protein ACFQWB_13435 [Paenibacillus thermoaerophilus]|uniref:Uncharacterized protein n=1 Tax=Paenibacillus thermoaerophilus TaxID=1215385 RepID=A0ABW2V7T2_9BACL|nr:hypothetical protein [Paenibacillus thermoaerophilus]TMV16170.1 hypothetical protein FE781_08885 [Paenibacillus thermoaerophilus]
MNRLIFHVAALMIAVVAISFLPSENAAPGFLKEEPEAEKAGGRVLWQLGQEDGSRAEFAEQASKAMRSLRIRGGPHAPQETAQAPGRMGRNEVAEFSLHFQLNEVPPYGVRLVVKIVDASRAIPQMAVYANKLLAGIVQIAGVGGTGSPHPYVKSYELYIPPEMLQTGDNTIRLESIRCLYCTGSEDRHLWWEWDYVRLEALAEAAEEPVHGRYVRMGTALATRDYYYDETAVSRLPVVLKWLGLAYSGNVMRAGCPSNVNQSCSRMREYYETLKSLNTGAVALHLYTGDLTVDADGKLPLAARLLLRDYLAKYGAYIQFMEVDNEPGLFGRSQAVNAAVANWLRDNRANLAPHLQIVSPGWSYWPTGGTPDGWERDPAQRGELEALTDWTNGHAYGTSYVDRDGGSFVENLKTFGPVTDGLPKPMLTTEIGTTDSHLDPAEYGAADKRSAVFDRNLRAHVGYADVLIQHQALMKDYALFDAGKEAEEHPERLAVHPFEHERDNRVRIFRRIAAAYATHGSPLPYVHLNRQAVENRKLYVRAVDTSALPPLPGSGAVSDRVLVSFVNFDSIELETRVRIGLPSTGSWTVEEIGNGDTFAEAYKGARVLNTDGGFAELHARLGAGDTLQFILTPDA